MTSVKFLGSTSYSKVPLRWSSFAKRFTLEREHKVLGQLAVDEKLLTAEQANEINQEQLNRDLPFGKLAIEQGFSPKNRFRHWSKRRTPNGFALAKRSFALGISMRSC